MSRIQELKDEIADLKIELAKAQIQASFYSRAVEDLKEDSRERERALLDTISELSNQSRVDNMGPLSQMLERTRLESEEEEPEEDQEFTAGMDRLVSPSGGIPPSEGVHWFPESKPSED